MNFSDYLKSKAPKESTKVTEFGALLDSGDKNGILKYYFKNSPVYHNYKQTKTYEDSISLVKSEDDEKSRRFAKISDDLKTISIYRNLSEEPMSIQNVDLFKETLKLR